MENTMETLPLRQGLCFALGHVMNDICASMWFTYLLVYFQMVQGWPANLAGILMLIGQVADALSTPFVGLQADLRDDFWMCRYGRRKTWHLVGTLCVALSFPFIFSSCVGCYTSHQWAQLVYYAAFVCIFQFGWASVQVSHLSLIPDLTPSAHLRTHLITLRYMCTVLSNMLVYGITWSVLHISSGSDDIPIGPQDLTSFQIVVAAGLGIGVICSIAFHIGVREARMVSLTGSAAPNSISAGTQTQENQKTAADQMCTIQLYQIAGVYMATRLFANLSQVYTPLYLHEQGLGAPTLAKVPLIMLLSSYFTSFIVKPLNKHCSRKVAYVIGACIGLAGCIWVGLGAGQIFSIYEVDGVAVLLGASSCILLVTSLGLTADLIGNDTDSGAFVYGAMSFVDKLSNGIAISLLQAYFHHDYRDVLAFVCGGAVIVGLICISTLSQCCSRTSSITVTEEESSDNTGSTDTEHLFRTS